MIQTSMGARASCGAGLRLAAVMLLVTIAAQAKAYVLISDFSNFSQTGTYDAMERWDIHLRRNRLARPGE